MAVKGLDYGEVLKTVAVIKSQRLRNKIADMEYETKQKTAAKAEARNIMAQEYIRMGQPAADPEMGMPPENLAAQEYGQPQEAIPPSFDRKGYGEALLRSGDIEGYKQVGAEGQAEQKAELDRVAKVYAMNPVAGTRMWNDGILGQEHGRVEHLGVKDGMQIINNPKTGEIVGINKKTYEVKVLREGKAVAGGMEDAGKELTARTKIANLVNKDLQAKYGRSGIVYDKMMEKWVFPPGFDQARFWKDYNKLEGVYQKEYGIKPIEKEEKWPEFKSGKGGERPPLSSFYGE